MNWYTSVDHIKYTTEEVKRYHWKILEGPDDGVQHRELLGFEINSFWLAQMYRRLLSILLPEDRNRSSFRNVVFLLQKTLVDGKSPKTQ
jgi:hypothetical protein